MSWAKHLRRVPALATTLALLAAVISPAGPATAATQSGAPKVATGGTSGAHGNSATLLGSIDPRGAATSYYFQYGPTVAYGKQTIGGNLPSGTVRVKVGQVAIGLLAGYHYRLVATNEHGPAFGRDRTFAVKQPGTAGFTLAKSLAPTPFGGTYLLSGALTGTASAGRALALQASPYPFLEAFAAVGLPTHTDAAGRFSFHVASLTKTTQFRVVTLDPRPVYSHIVTQGVSVRVILKVRPSGHPGLLRLYGTVTPAKPGARLDFQLFKQVRPGNSSKGEERTGRFATQFSTVVKRATATVSRFSAVVTVRRAGAYRAYVNLNSRSAVVSGASRAILLHAAPGSTHR